MARSRRSEKKIRSLVEFFEFVLTIWRTNPGTIADPAGRHIACSQFPGCKAGRSPQDRRFDLSVATFLRHNLCGEDRTESLAEIWRFHFLRTTRKCRAFYFSIDVGQAFETGDRRLRVHLAADRWRGEQHAFARLLVT